MSRLPAGTPCLSLASARLDVGMERFGPTGTPDYESSATYPLRRCRVSQFQQMGRHPCRGPGPDTGISRGTDSSHTDVGGYYSFRRIGLTKPARWLRTIAGGLAIGTLLHLIAPYTLVPLTHLVASFIEADSVAGRFGTQFDQQAGQNWQFFVLALSISWIQAGFFEEFIYRGFLLNKLSEADEDAMDRLERCGHPLNQLFRAGSPALSRCRERRVRRLGFSCAHRCLSAHQEATLGDHRGTRVLRYAGVFTALS